jgi:hypothetical protein
MEGLKQWRLSAEKFDYVLLVKFETILSRRAKSSTPVVRPEPADGQTRKIIADRLLTPTDSSPRAVYSCKPRNYKIRLASLGRFADNRPQLTPFFALQDTRAQRFRDLSTH